jgi:hemoglobin-like flavoprotein
MGLNVDLLRRSYGTYAVRMDQLTERFFSILFSKTPAVKPLFADVDLPSLCKMLNRALAVFMHHVESIDQLEPYLISLGKKHAGFGVRPDHFSHFQEALLEAMAETAPEEWDSETASAWDELLGVISAIMQQSLTDITAARTCSGR